jgi:pseudouridylate synthase
MLDSNLLKLSEEVEAAVRERRAIVALESTVISHGLPRPVNLETARRLERTVREAGATPATVALLGGRLRVGLNDEELERLAFGSGVLKVSRRDLPVAVALGLDGATTVAGTLWITSRAGLKVFATGGIGGVHRGRLPDVSADLPELAETPMTVVCSGAKSVLDLPATREWLETHGVALVGYGTDELPAFYSRRSGLGVDVRADSPETVARLARARDALGLSAALVVAVPVPSEFEVPADALEESLAEALSEAEAEGIAGRDLTPFLLAHMSRARGGTTLRANVALLESNARVAAGIARALASDA